jgi:hypothetical protein
MRTGVVARGLVAGVLAALLPVACTDDDGDDAEFEEGSLVAIEQVTGTDVDVEVRVRGPAFRVAGTTRICSAILESFPPQCGEPSLVVDGWDIDTDAQAQTAGDVTWVEDVELSGTIDEGVLRVATG